MNLLVCGSTAFRYYRIPPQYLWLYPAVPDTFSDSNHTKRAASPLVADILGLPIHRIQTSGSIPRNGKIYQTHLCTHELPFGCFTTTDHGFDVSSPAFTLLTLAPCISRLHLLMAAYELCGRFAVFSPSSQAEQLLEQAHTQGALPRNFGWQRVISTDGKKTDLWKRESLLEIEELRSFTAQIDGLKGAKALRWVAENISGVCASPFEVQASILLGLRRCDGGMGLSLQNNYRIPLSSQAQALYPHNCCYADLYIEAHENTPAVDIECQGSSAHNSEAAALSDSDRFAALESMGIQVVPLTYAQFSSAHSLRAVRGLLERKLDTRFRPKTKRQLEAEQKLWAEVFIDWNTLASPAFEKPRHARSR